MTLEFTSLTRFTKILIETRNKHAPIKKNQLAQTTQILLQKTYGKVKYLKPYNKKQQQTTQRLR